MLGTVVLNVSKPFIVVINIRIQIVSKFVLSMLHLFLLHYVENERYKDVN